MKTIQNTLLALILLISSKGMFAQELNQKDAEGKRNGQWTGIYDDTKLPRYEGTFNHGKEVGVFKYYENTAKKTLMATREFNDKDNTAYTIFYDPKMNKVSEGKVKGKDYEGVWTYYHNASPKVMTTENYVEGKLDGVRKVYYPNGKIAEERGYVKGVKEGVYKKYAESGFLIEEANFKAGQYDGKTTYYDSKGKVTIKGQFKNGKKNGVWTYYENNKVVKEENMSQVKKSIKAKGTK